MPAETISPQHSASRHPAKPHGRPSRTASPTTPPLNADDRDSARLPLPDSATGHRFRSFPNRHKPLPMVPGCRRAPKSSEALPAQAATRHRPRRKPPMRCRCRRSESNARSELSSSRSQALLPASSLGSTQGASNAPSAPPMPTNPEAAAPDALGLPIHASPEQAAQRKNRNDILEASR